MACVVAGRDHRDGGPVRRRARPQGGPDHDHLHAAARVVLLLPVRAAARGQAAGAGVPGHDRHPHDLPRCCCSCCRSTTAARSATRCAGRSPWRPASRPSRRWPTSRSSARSPARQPRSSSATAPQYEEGKEVTASSGCLGCHKIGENGGALGPNLTEIGARLGPQAIARTLVNPTRPCPPTRRCKDREPGAVRQAGRVRRLPQGRGVAMSGAGPASGTLPADAGAGDVRPHRPRLRPHELGDDGRDAPPLARARGRPGPASGPVRVPSTWPPAPATWRSSWPPGAPTRDRYGLLHGDARVGAGQGARRSHSRRGTRSPCATRTASSTP